MNGFDDNNIFREYTYEPIDNRDMIIEHKAVRPRRRHSQFGKFMGAGMLAIVLSFGSFGLGLSMGRHINNQEPVGFKAEAFPELNYTSVIHSDSDKTAVDVIKHVQPSVVSINVTATATNFFYGNFEVTSAGSGIIFYEDAENLYIVTNNHVISGANAVSVSVDDNNSARASFLGSDSEADIAVIKVAKSDLQAAGITDYKIATFGDASAMEVGETVIAIGNAYGEGKSATMGIVSAKDKDIYLPDNITLNVIQTDAAINPGNSGGALVNMSGQVIGVNTAKLAESEAEGMGYAIPSNTVISIVEDIIEKGSVERPYIGLQGYDITEDTRDAYSFPSLGVYVVRVSTENRIPVNELRAGDIIVSYNGNPVRSMVELQAYIAQSRVGTQHTLGVYRNNELIDVVVTIRNSNVDSNF